MSLINELNNSFKYVSEHSRNVSINYANVDKMIDDIKNRKINYWLDSNPYSIMDMSIEEIINFLLIYHTVGDYCFWGDLKWKINTPEGTLDGTYAMIYVLINRYKKSRNFNLRFSEFGMLLGGSSRIKLLDDRYNNLLDMNKILKGNSFYEMIKDFKSDEELLEFVIDSFPYFEDKAMYDNHEILFYKRAQLFVSDIIHTLNTKGAANIDYSNLIGCADYKIPQVMRGYGMLAYDKELAFKVDNYMELPENCKDEIEIRANELAVIDYMYHKLNGKYNRMDINDYIWLLGQDKKKELRPYHRTLTNHY